jgi:Reverse transcriptase (RNA-dependent DNA polymerase)/gag-polypeptide of LTR copia-type/Integrase core domain
MESTRKIKFDLDRLPKLTRDVDFQRWKAAWVLCLRYNKLYDHVDGTVPDDDSDEWMEKDTEAKILLMQAVADDALVNVPECETAREAWLEIHKRYEKDTTANVVYLLRNVMATRLQNSALLRQHLDTFDSLWGTMARRVKSSTNTIAKAMAGALNSDELKGTFFLTTLPPDLDNVVDNLATREVTDFETIRSKLVDMLDARGSADEALAVTNAGKTPKPGSPNSSGKSDRECTYCKKRGFNAKGHLWKDCRKLKRAQDEEDKTKKSSDNTPKATKSKQQEAKANAVEEVQADIEDAVLVASDSVLSSLSSAIPPTPWIFDTGATRHVSGFRSDFVELSPCTGSLTIADGSKVPVLGRGTCVLFCELHKGHVTRLKLTNVLYSPMLPRRLFSWACLKGKGLTLVGREGEMTILRDGRPLVMAKEKNGAIEVCTSPYFSSTPMHRQPSSPPNSPLIAFSSYDEFHAALGHAPAVNKSLYADGEAIPDRPANFECVHCLLGKSVHHKPHSNPDRATRRFQIIHCDLSGTLPMPSLSGNRYYIAFLDEYTREPILRFLKIRSEAETHIRDLIAFAEQRELRIEIFHCDNAGELVSLQLRKFFASKGIELQTSPPRHHESNGMAERLNRTLYDDARTMLVGKPQELLAEALSTAAYLRTLKPHASLPGRVTPYERIHNKKPTISHLRPFFADCCVHIPPESRPAGSKLMARAEMCKLVGYQGLKAYRLWNPANGKVQVASDVVFTQWKKPDMQPNSISKIPPTTLFNPRELQWQPVQTVANHPPPRYPDTVKWDNEKEEATILATLGVPATVRQAMDSNESADWTSAMEREIKALEDNGTWSVERMPHGKTLIDTKWVFAKKFHADGTLAKYKARLVARGFTQRSGWDYDQTYSPVARLETMRIVLAVAAHHQWDLWQIDFETAYLNGTLDHEIYIKPPKCTKVEEGEVLRLRKALYGLKQSGRQWHKLLATKLHELGLKQLQFDACCFKGEHLIVLVYVDDLLIAGTHDAINSFRQSLCGTYKFKDLGPCKYLLGFEIDRRPEGIYLSQKGYVEKLLSRFHMDKCNPRKTPMDNGTKLEPRSDNDKAASIEEYQQLLGSVNWLMIGSRPDISCATTMLGWFSANPSDSHRAIANQLLRYLRYTQQALFFPFNKPMTLDVWTDATWASTWDGRSVQGLLAVVAGCTVTWKSKKQASVALSSCESEYMGGSNATQTLLWIHGALIELGFEMDIDSTRLHCDNLSAIENLREDKSRPRTRHINAHFHFVAEHIDRTFRLQHIPGTDNPADAFTKLQPLPRFQESKEKMGLRPMEASGGAGTLAD